MPLPRADYASRRSGNQEENLRRRANGHQMPLSARGPLEGRARDSRDTSSNLRARSSKGTLYMNPTRRRGRPAHQRSPDDSPLRDGNRDRVIGLLTLRAAKTLEYYFVETNLTYHHWLSVRPSPDARATPAAAARPRQNYITGARHYKLPSLPPVTPELRLYVLAVARGRIRVAAPLWHVQRLVCLLAAGRAECHVYAPMCMRV